MRQEPDPYALRAARRRVRITMYSTSWCGYCRRARAYMDAEGIAYVEHDVEADARAAQRLRSLNPRGSVPTFEIDGETRIGFSPRNLEIAIDEAARRHL
ncbi:MAG: glutaredoxin family protein [Sandaracinaceae bacterium]|nr:glutaredoxin family protein [Sandaracinaceae bacterium]